MRACGICHQDFDSGSGYTDLVRSRSGHLRLTECCGLRTDGDVSTRTLILVAGAFSSIALMAGLVSYLVLGVL